MKKLNSNKGFTLIELLVVIAIIGILAAITITSVSSARTKAQKAAFKSEVSAYSATAITTCDDGTQAPPSDTSTTNWAASFTASSCGSAGSGTFTITAVPVATALSACLGTVTETGAVFNSSCN